MFEFMKMMTLRATFAAEGAGTLPPFLGSTVRGILGHCFREFVCDKRSDKCFACDDRYSCSYVRFFSNTGAEGGALNPYVLNVHVRGKTEWAVGDECVFDLRLFGNVAANPGIYLDALVKMEEKGWGVQRIPYSLKSVTDPDTGRLIYAAGKNWMGNLVPHSMKMPEGNPGAVLVAFQSPLRIVSRKELFKSLPFDTFIRFLARRISNMAQIYTDFRMELDEQEMMERASGIQCTASLWRDVPFSRYSMNQKNGKLELPAKTGWALYEGELSPFVPYIEAGRYLHVGKNTTIGFGQYEVYYDEEVR